MWCQDHSFSPLFRSITKPWTSIKPQFSKRWLMGCGWKQDDKPLIILTQPRQGSVIATSNSYKALIIREDVFGGQAKVARLAGLSGGEFPVWRCSGSRLVGEEQREFFRDSPLKFLLAHRKARWGSPVTCDANSSCCACWCCTCVFVVSCGKRNVIGNMRQRWRFNSSSQFTDFKRAGWWGPRIAPSEGRSAPSNPQ